MSYVLSCCSTADLTKEYFEKRNIKYICFHFQLDGMEYIDDLGETMPFDVFYKSMENGAMTRTSQVSTGEYEEYFESYLAAGQDVVHLTLSSGISGSYQSAKLAQESLQKKYPERKLYVIDSLAAASGYGLLMDVLADKRDAGMDVDELAAWAEDNKLTIQHWFTPTDLTYLIRGGRVSKTAGFFGKMLNICPVMDVDYQGKLIARDKVRTKRRALRELVARMEERARDRHDYNGRVFISHSASLADAQYVAQLVTDLFPKINGKPEIFSIGTTIGAHTGPGTVTLFFEGDKRDN